MCHLLMSAQIAQPLATADAIGPSYLFTSCYNNDGNNHMIAQAMW